jgi:hypothetical protein
MEVLGYTHGADLSQYAPSRSSTYCSNVNSHALEALA